MNKKYIIVGSIALFQLSSKAQNLNNGLDEKLKKTEIELVYNHYLQDGDHSAVTGGEGTEELTIYGPQAKVKTTSGKNTLDLTIGADIITSASTDNINFVMSSASLHDMRSHVAANYSRAIEEKNLSLDAGAAFSMESDYMSIGYNFGFTKDDKKKLRTFSSQLQIFHDDLRWGRLKKGEWRPQTVVYPRELRDTAWHDEFRRHSFNLKLGFTQIINKRNILGIFPDFTFQKGLLSTPFHRIYFIDESLAVEQLPDSRLKGTLALKLNTFVKGNLILKNSINGYVDNFGVVAISFANETAVKVNPFLTLLPNARFYTQRGAPFFEKKGQHSSSDEFYTSDYDYADSQTYNVGMGLKYSPFRQLSKRMKFNSFLFRYNFMYRSDGLTAHIFSVAFLAELTKKPKGE